MIRPSILSVLIAVSFAVALALANGPTLGQLQTAQSVEPTSLSGSSGCQTKVDGKTLLLQPGEGVWVDNRWRNCRTYEGHPVIIYSAEPPKQQQDAA